MRCRDGLATIALKVNCVNRIFFFIIIKNDNKENLMLSAWIIQLFLIFITNVVLSVHLQTKVFKNPTMDHLPGSILSFLFSVVLPANLKKLHGKKIFNREIYIVKN